MCAAAASAAAALLALGLATVGAVDYPLPPRQTPIQRGVMTKVQALAPRSSQRALNPVLHFLDEPGFRAHLRGCCPSVASLSAPALYARFKAEVSTMELVHNWDPRPNGSPMDELNMSTWIAAKYDYNLWQMSVLGLKRASFLFNCDLAEVGLFGYPPFPGVVEGSGDLPATFALASDRPTYTALNLWRNSVGNPKFGPVSAVFSPSYTHNMTFVLPVDSGLWEGSCNRSHRQHNHRQLQHHHWGNRMNCSAWNRTDANPLLGTLDDYDHVSQAWLSEYGIWQPSYSSSIPARLFERLFGEKRRTMTLTDEEGSSGQLYWEGQISGNILFPEGVKMLVGQYDQLFGTSTGQQLQVLCKKNRWVLLWGLGEWNITDNGGGSHHHWSPPTDQNYTFSGRVFDPTVLAGSTAAHNQSVSPATTASWSKAWQTAAATRRNNSTGLVWQRMWKALPSELQVEPVRPGDCGSVNACVGVDVAGKCLCYSDRA